MFYQRRESHKEDDAVQDDSDDDFQKAAPARKRKAPTAPAARRPAAKVRRCQSPPPAGMPDMCPSRNVWEREPELGRVAGYYYDDGVQSSPYLVGSLRHRIQGLRG